MLTYLLFLAPAMILGFWAQHRVTSNFRCYSEVPSPTGMTGAQVARQILDRNGLQSVEVLATPGELSDHYDPRTRTVNLSEPVYAASTVAAVAVAAHEVGHAIQHQERYAPMSFRSALAPVAAFGSNAFQILLITGIVLMFLVPILGQWAILLGVALYSFAVLFHIVTLPVEFNASSRARAQLNSMAVVTQGDDGTNKVLNAAALTYVAGALMAVTQLVYYAMTFLGSDE